MIRQDFLGKRWAAMCLALLTALQPLTGYAQAIGEAIRNADKPMPHVLPIADRANMLPLPYVPTQWAASSSATGTEHPKVAPGDDDDDDMLPIIIAALRPVCTGITANPTSTTANTQITLNAACTFKGNLVRHHGFFRTDQATNLMTYVGDAPAGSTSLTTNAPSTVGTYTYTVLALNGGIPSKPIPGVAVAVTVVPPSSCVISGPNATNALAPNASGTLGVSCTGGSTPFTYAWTRSTPPAGFVASTALINDVPFTSNSPASTTYSVTVSNSSGSQVVSKTVANAAAVSVQITSVSSSTGGTTPSSGGSIPTAMLNATFTKSCAATSTPSMRVYLNGTLAYSGGWPIGDNKSFAVARAGVYKIDTTLICDTVQVAAAQQSYEVLAKDFPVATAPADVEDVNAPNAVGNTVGTLPGSASVNPSGAVTYSIPMPVVPGTAGMQPSIALSYSSQAGRGIVGTGWSLSGFSTIHRCPATIVLDGYKGRIGFDGYDRYCMDGMRLIAITGADGGDGTEYRTERDSYARIYSLGSNGYGPTSWTVETKSGQTLTFNDPLYQSSVDGSTFYSNKIKAWGISRAEDTVGNYMTFTYAATHTKGWLLPTAINYTGNTAAGLSTYAQVQIGYDTSVRADSAIIYDGTGSYGEIPPLVNRITSTDSSVTANAIAHQLSLTYESSLTTGRTRLISAKLCGGGADSSSGLCLPATNFNYNNAAVSASTPWIDNGSIGFSVNPNQGGSLLAADVNGDGKTEVISGIAYQTSTLNIVNANTAAGQGIYSINCQTINGTVPPCAYDVASTPQLGDFNGDGRTDFVAVMHLMVSGVEQSRYVVCLGRTNSPTGGFDCEIKLDWGLQNNYRDMVALVSDGNYVRVDPVFIVGDFDGDGKSDVMELGRAPTVFEGNSGGGEPASWIYLDYQQNATSSPRLVSGVAAIASAIAADTLILGDFDGDGRLDIAALTTPQANDYSSWTTWLSRVSTAGTTAFSAVTALGPRKHDYQPHIADVNGDGLADLLAFDGNPEMWTPTSAPPDYGITPYLGQFRWHGCLSRGNGTFDCSVWRGPPSGEFEFAGRKFPLEILGDFNGDGRTDVAIYDPDYSADNPSQAGRWWICVARPNPPSNPERGAFDCGPTITGSQLGGGGIWTNGLRRKGRTQINPNKYEYDIVVAGDFKGDGRTGLAGGLPAQSYVPGLSFPSNESNFPRITRLNIPDPVASIPDMLASVTNGLGFTNSFKYKPITDNAVYTKYNTSTTYPILDIQTAMYVATEASHDDGIGGTKTYTYKYEGLTGHVIGGGSLGFAKVIVTDGQSGIVTTTEYDNTYPARGLVKKTEKRNSNTNLLNRSSSTYKFIEKIYATADADVRSKIHAYLPENAKEESWELDGTTKLPVTQTITSYLAGDNAKYGCATGVAATTYAADGTTVQFTKTVTNTYGNDVPKWRLCRLATASVESTQSVYSAALASETRNSSFAYNDTTNGLLIQEAVQPTNGSQAVTLTTNYQHDAYGNRKQADVTGWNGTVNETRTSTTTYDNRGRYPIQSVRVLSPLNHVEDRTYSPTLGVQLTSTFDGITTAAKYDKLGRKVTEKRDDANNLAGIKTAMSYTASPYGGVTVTSKVTGGGQSSVDSDRLGREVRKSVYIADNGSLRWSRVNTVYDARGRVDKVSRPYFDGNAANYPCSRQYDNIDRVFTETCANDAGLPTSTSTAFNGLSTTLTVTAPDSPNATATTSRVSTTLLDARGMTQKVTNNQLSTVEHSYDAAGNLVRTTRTANTGGTMTTALTYDLRGRKLTLSDPDTGSYGYTYNAFGELLKQTDGKNQPTDSLYDKLGRVTQRSSNGELISDYTYDNCTKGLGKLCTVTAKGSASPSGSAGTVGHSRTLTYDSVGRLNGETTVIGAKSYTAGTDFDLAGHIKTINYPNGQFVTRLYDEVGAWKQLLGSNGLPLWTGGNADAEAHWLNWTLGNGRSTNAAFGANTGRLSTLTTDGSVQSLALTYDGFGNIKTRLDVPNGYKQASGAAESFTYDDLNQLKTAVFQEGTQSINYDGFGRITSKTDPGVASFSYQYRGSSVSGGGSTSNRLQSVNGRNYIYDDGGGLPGNGNVTQIESTAAGTVTLSWTSFNQPLSLPVAAAQNASATATGNVNAAILLKYGADNQRVLELLPIDATVTGANQTAQRYVLHSGANLFYEEDVRADNTIEQRAYLTGPLGVVAVHTTNTDSAGNPVTPTGQQLNAQNNNGTPYTLTYWHRDHLGSLTVTTDDTGIVKERLRFDPWGKPMTALGSKARTGDRGFTGHEHLAGGLIHMNGRIYDPVLGRFLSADIVVQMPSVIGSYNRYSYVLNNPLALTDPSGYLFGIDDIIFLYLAAASAAAGAIASATGHGTAARRFFAAAITFASVWLGGTSMMVSAAGEGGAAASAAFWGAAGAFAAGGIQSGSLEGAVLAGISAGFFAGAGGIADSIMGAEAAAIAGGAPGEYAAAANASAFSVGGIGRAGLHFGAAAASAMIRGTDPLRSGFSAGFAELSGPFVSGTGVGIENFAAHVVAGGVGEVIAGGKFANGAMTGAFAWLYNHAKDLEKRGAGSVGGDGLRRSGNQPQTREESSDPRIRQTAQDEALQSRSEAAYRVGENQYTQTAGKHMYDVVGKGEFKGQLARPYMTSQQTIAEISSSGLGRADPGGVPGALRFDVPGTFRGSTGTWQLVIHPQTNMIYHFNFVR